MKAVILIFTLTVSMNLQAIALDKKACAVALEEVTGKGKPANIQAAKIEIAELLLERARLDDKSEAALRSLLEKNIRKKIGEFKETFGVELDSIEIKKLIAQIEKGSLKKEKEGRKKEQEVRKQEDKSLAITKEYFSEDMKNLHELDDTYFDNSRGSGNNNITGSGVQWSGDEKYVVFRNFDGESWIYNVEDKKFLDYHPATGVISGSGHLYAENDKDQTIIRDLDTGEQWGPIKGNPPHQQELFNSEFIITNYEIKSPKFPYLKDWVYTLIDFRNNRQIELGIDFAISLDHRLVVRKSGKTKIEVIDVASGNIVKRFTVQEKDLRLTASPDGSFTFKRNSKVYFVRLSDMKVFELPTRDEPNSMSADGTKLIFRGKPIVVYDLNTKKRIKFKDLDEYTMSPDGMHVIIHHFQTTKTVWVDLATMATRDLPGDYERWSPNGRWVYNLNSGGQWTHSLFDLETGKKFSFKAGFDFNFIGQTNFALTETSDPAKAFVNDMNQWTGNPYSLQIGFTEAKPSPSGKFILTYNKGGKVTLSAFGVQ